MDDILVMVGGAVKSLGGGAFEAPLVTFTGPNAPDLAGDFFTAQTDFWQEFPAKIPLLYNHGQDPELKKRRIGTGTLELKADSVWLRGQIALADEYQSDIEEMIRLGKLGTSSGSATHMVEREPVGKAFRLTSWPIIEASLTPTPCEKSHFGRVVPLTGAPAVKSFKAILQEMADAEGTPPPAAPDPVTPPAVKAKYLGEDIEDSLSFAVVSRLNDALMYNCVMPCLMQDDGPNGETSTADKLATLRPAFDEFRDMSLRVLEAVLSAAGDETPAEAGKSLMSLYAKPSADPHAPRAARLLESLEFKTFLQAMGSVAALTDARASWYEAERAVKQGRALSADNLAAMRDIHDGMKEHVGKLGDLIARHSQGAPPAGNSQSSGNKPKPLGSEMGAAFMRFMQAHGGTATLAAPTAGQSVP